MSKKYIIRLEYTDDGHKVLEWLKEAHFKNWFTSTTNQRSSACDFFIEVICTSGNFEPWFTLKLETSISILKGGVELYIKI